jgi:diaminopimelate decarboxylase
MEYNTWLRKKDLEYKNKDLNFGDINLRELSEEYSTPFYLVNEKLIRKRYNNLKSLLNTKYKNNEIHYAVKANSNLAILKILESEGASVDCSSVGEVRSCLKAGIPSERIIYTGNMFTNEDLEFAVKNDILVNLDSISQLDRLNRIYEKLDKEKMPLSFRINPEFGAGHHAHTITAGKDIKFGILDDQVIEAYRKAQEYGFSQFGTHIHIGSGILDPDDFKKAFNKYIDIILHLSDTLDITFNFVDFGGGLGIPYHPREEPLNLDLYMENLLEPFNRLLESGDFGTPNLKIEPGRYIVGESSVLVTQINTIKNNGYKKFLGVDAGFQTLIRPTMYDSYHHIIHCQQKDGEIDTYDVAGPICESGDILGHERKITAPAEGDCLAILDVGAYGFTMASVYNSRPRPAELLINDGKVHVIREEETYEDLFKHQKVPKHLK